jgi:hypothetical protein
VSTVEVYYREIEGVVYTAARGSAGEAGGFLASSVGGFDIIVAGEGGGVAVGEFLNGYLGRGNRLAGVARYYAP